MPVADPAELAQAIRDWSIEIRTLRAAAAICRGYGYGAVARELERMETALRENVWVLRQRGETGE